MMKQLATAALPAALLVLAIGAGPAVAQEAPVQAQGMPMAETGHGGHGEMGMSGATGDGDASSASDAYRAANARMHGAMDIDFTGDPDVDFARGMIGHHQGAIEMAKIVLEYGSDPGLKDLASAIISAQEGEIAFLRAWLAEHGAE